MIVRYLFADAKIANRNEIQFKFRNFVLYFYIKRFLTMFKFLKYLLQLALSPAQGWADISKDEPDASTLAGKGLYPLLALTAVTEFLDFVYHNDAKLSTVLVHVLADFGAYFISIFIAKLLFEMYLGRLTASKPDANRVAVCTVAGIGLLVVVQIIENCLPYSFIVLKFLPVYVILVLYKATSYLGVAEGNELRFLGLSAMAVVIVPLLIYNLFLLIV